MDWGAIVTSAAVGALASAVVTGISQWRERIGRKRELMLNMAWEITRQRHEMLVANANRNNQPLYLPDAVFMVEKYFQWLEHLSEHGELPREASERRDADAQRISMEKALMRDDRAE
jgi:hypothetical protein